MRSFYRTLLWVVVFSVAMGYLETSVVVYLREIYYPDGFRFPLVAMPLKNVMIELLREAATLVMLLGVGFMAGRSGAQRFAWSILSFAVWDLSYYIFLKLLLDWPAGLLTWDILFLIPVPWVGPVLAPCLVSVTMILAALMILRFEAKGISARMSRVEKSLMLAGSVIVIVSFCDDFLKHASSLTEEAVQRYVPVQFDWWVFILGELLIGAGMVMLWRRLSSLVRSR